MLDASVFPSQKVFNYTHTAFHLLNWYTCFRFGFLLVPNILFHKLSRPYFLAGKMAKELTLTSSLQPFNPFKTTVFSSGCIKLFSLVLQNLAFASSSASIWSNRDGRFFTFMSFKGTLTLVVFVIIGRRWAAIMLSKIDTSVVAAIAFNCFSRLRMVSWHSANFSEAAVISHSCRICKQTTSTQYSSRNRFSC